MKKVCVFLMFILSVYGIFSAYATTDIAADAESSECTENITGTYSGDANFKAKWTPNNIQLTWCDGYTGTQIIPANTSANTCNYGGALTIPNNPPERIGYIFDGWRIQGLPTGYTRLEYIESTGTQYIDTGILYDSSKILQFFFDGRTTNGDATTYVMGWNAGGMLKTGSGYWDFFDSASLHTSNLSANIRTKVSMTINSGSSSTTIYNFVQGDTEENYSRAHSGISTYTSVPFPVFAVMSYSLIKGKSAVYGFKAYSDNTLVQKLVPARRNSDNEIGMYDTVSQTFFTNAGTGSFIAGPELY